MPRVAVRSYSADEFDHGQGLARGVAAFGHALAGGIRDQARSRTEAAKEARVAAENDRKLAIEEAEAEAKLTKEKNESAARAEVEAEKQADRDVAVAEFRRSTANDSQDALRQDVGAALRRSGGVLGPFGILNTKAMGEALKRQSAIGKRMEGDIALASGMTRPAARAYLQRAAEDIKGEVISSGYQEEFDLLNGLVMEEKIDPARAKEYGKELQAGARARKPPGDVHKRLMQESELYVQAQTRAEDWEKADVQATGMIDGLRKLVAEMPDGVDPITGKSVKAGMMERLAAAKVEWNRTKPGENGVSVFRQKNDAAGSLDGLQKILFEAQIEADPEAFMQRDRADSVPTPSRDEVVAAIGGMGGGHRTQGGAVEGFQEPAQEAPPARGGKQQPAADRQRQQLATLVREEAQKALRAGGDRRERLDALRERVAKELGLEKNSPEVHAIIKNELARAFAPR
jgi:hypothetical protein